MTAFKSKTLFLTIACLFISIIAAYSGDNKYKWGKVSKEEIELKTVPYDEEAHAVMLAKTGILSYFNQNFTVQIYCRIKILDSKGVSEGDIVLPYYSKDNLEKIRNVKAQTLEILENGKVEKHSLNKDQLFDTQVNENWSQIRFAMPAVKAGTILEYSYTLITSNFTFLEGWTFQNEIPTLYSYYKVEIPQFFTYNTLMQGNRIYQKYHDKTATNNWELKNLPALKQEPFTYNLRDYAEKVQFQLHSYTTRDKYSGITSEKEMFVDWDAITKEVLGTKAFWSYSHNKNLLQSILQEIPSSANRDEFAGNIYKYVQNKYSWNDYYGLLPDKDLKELISGKSGNTASINLLLVNLLEVAGFEAYPIYLSTKSHGGVNPKYPILSQFNHLNALVIIGAKEHILNAAGNPMAFGLLPIEDLNKRALVLSKEKSRWIEVKDLAKSYSLINYKTNIAKGLETYHCTWRGFEALKVEKHLQNKDYHKVLMSKDFNIVQDSVKIENTFSAENLLKASFYFSGKNKWEAEKIFYDLSLPEFLEENSFKNEKRIFPVDFGYTNTTHLTFEIIIPENYRLQEQPETLLLKLPDGSTSFIYQNTLNGNLLTIQLKLDIHNNFIPQENYLHLREFFSKMINHCQQPYVFVKVP